MATHVFMVSEEVEPVDTVKAWLIEGNKNTTVELKENHTLKTSRRETNRSQRERI
jgi:hypothetical protein